MISNKLDEQDLEFLRNIRIHSIIGVPDNGRNIQINCPFHSDKTPSCIINTNNSFKCFGCGKSGFGAIDFFMSFGLSFNEALKELEKYI